MSRSGAGKGDKRRPSAVPSKTYENNYTRVFGKRIPWYERPEHQENVKELRSIKANDNRG